MTWISPLKTLRRAESTSLSSGGSIDFLDGRADVFQALAHPVVVSPEGKDADPDREASPQDRPGQIDAFSGVDTVHEALVDPVQLSIVEAAPGPSERCDRKLGLGQDLDERDPAKLLRGPLREIELLVEVVAKRLDSHHLDREPQAQAAPAPRQLRRDLVEIHEVRVLLHRGEVNGRE